MNLNFLSFIFFIATAMTLYPLASWGSTHEIAVVFGNKKTNFKVEPSKKVLQRDGSGGVQSISLSKSNLDFIQTEIQKIVQMPSNKGEFCPRQYIALESSSKVSLACIGSATPIATRLTNLANLLETSFHLTQ